VEGAKVRLSDHPEAEVRLVNADLHLQHPLARAAFEAAIEPQVRAAHGCVEVAVAAADIALGEIDLVLTTGGSSRIPAFRRMLRAVLPAAKLQESDLFTSVASGLAVSGALRT
jgi:molecular chaperone DnaK (HSP70)